MVVAYPAAAGNQLDELLNVLGGQAGGEVAADVPNSQIPVVAEVRNGPPVAVLHPIRRGEAEPAVVVAGDDHIAHARLIPIG
jgi:hypothetical protein